MIMPLDHSEPIHIRCLDYCPEEFRIEEIDDVPAFLESHRPAWSRVRWIQVEGLADIDIVESLAEKYQLHPLALEDVLHTVERPKVEDYQASEGQPGRLFIVGRAVHLDTADLNDERLVSEQVSMFLGRSTLLTFQTRRSDVFDSIRRRVQTRGSQLRENEVSFLLYALLDTIVDSYFPMLERSDAQVEDLEEELLDRPGRHTLERVHSTRRDLLTLRRAAWPMRELIAQLLREKHECLSETTRHYFRDIYDHCVQIIDLIENYREIAAALTETYMSVVSSRLNEIMKVLTVIGTVFLPLTFLAGVYGMNMPIPENQWWFSYPMFWLLCAAIAGTMIYWFHRRGWI
jgi:magnesium transporter